jgi:hypothetical protein
MKDKTVFIYVNQGFAIRYLLRSSVLKTIISEINRIVILSHNGNETTFKKTFEKNNVIVEQVKFQEFESFINSSKLIRSLILLRSFILNGTSNTQTVDDFRKIFLHEKGWKMNQGILAWSRGIIWTGLCLIFKKIKFLRKLLINFESNYSKVLPHSDLFEKYSPDLVVVTGLCGFKYNEQIARESIHNGTPVCNVVLSWDNTSGMGMAGYNPDFVVAWTENMKKELIRLNDISEEKIYVGGVAHFDHYYDETLVLEKKILMNKLGLDMDKRIIFYATKSPKRFPWGPSLVEDIALSIENNLIDKNAQILVRIHPLHYRREKGKFVFQNILDEFNRIELKYPSVVLNKPKMLSKEVDFYMDDSEEILVYSILKHASVMLNMFSTMAIEAAILDLPIINVCIQDKCKSDLGKSKQDIMVDYWQSHNQRIIQTEGAKTAFTHDELIDDINYYLNNPFADSDKRKLIVNNEAGPFKGNAGHAIGTYISNLV